jgi:hypothetical protein
MVSRRERSYDEVAMDSNRKKPILERAFELAKYGTVGSVDDLLLHLSMEGYRLSALPDRAVKDELRELIKRRPHPKP